MRFIISPPSGALRSVGACNVCKTLRRASSPFVVRIERITILCLYVCNHSVWLRAASVRARTRAKLVNFIVKHDVYMQVYYLRMCASVIKLLLLDKTDKRHLKYNKYTAIQTYAQPVLLRACLHVALLLSVVRAAVTNNLLT